MRRDAVVGLVGALILLVALAGVFRYESANVAGGPSYALAAPKALAAFDGTASPNQGYNANVSVAEPNLTRLDFRLEASSGTFNLSVKGPNGQAGAAQGTGKVVVSFDVAPLPANGTAPPEPAGQGNWTVTVTLVDAGSATPTVPVTVPVVGQNGVAFKVTPYATEYEAR